MREVGVEHAQVLHQGLEAAGLPGLALEGADLALHLLDDVGDAEKIRLGVLEFAEGLFLLRLVLRDAGGLFEDGATVLGTAVEQLRRATLLHDGVGAAPDTGVHEETVDVLQAAGGAVDEVLGLAVAEDAAGDADFIPLHAQLLFTLGEGHRDLGHIVGLTGIGAVENDIGHFTAAKGLGRLLAEHPADGVQNVRFTASVRTDDGGHPAVEAEDRLGGEGFEADQLEGLEIHEKVGEMGV